MAVCRFLRLLTIALGLAAQTANGVPVRQYAAAASSAVTASDLYSGQRIAHVYIESDIQARELEDKVMQIFDSRVVPGRHVQVRATDAELHSLRREGYVVDVRIHDIDSFLDDHDQHPYQEQQRARRQPVDQIFDLPTRVGSTLPSASVPGGNLPLPTPLGGQSTAPGLGLLGVDAASSASAASISTAPAADFHSRYNKYTDIVSYLSGLVTTGRNIRVNVSYSTMSLTTAENRALPVVEIGDPNAPYVIYLQGGIHAREWIASSSLMFALDQLITNFNSLPYSKNIRFSIAPMVNPDGYEYSRTQDRFWRQNRATNNGCIGVDLNRNFNGFNSWAPGYCGETYSGPRSFSEKETQAIRAHLQRLGQTKRVVAAIDFHAFSQWIMWPPGYFNAPAVVPDHVNLEKAGESMRLSILKNTNTSFSATTSADFYPASGACDDWMYDKIVVNPNPKAPFNKGLVYTIELPPTDSSNLGFVLPPKEIKPVGRMVYAAIDAMARYVQSQIKK